MTSGQREPVSLEAIERQVLSAFQDETAFPADALARFTTTLAAHARALRAGRADTLATRSRAEQSATAVSAHLAVEVCPRLMARFAALLPITDAEGTGRTPGEATAADYAEALAAIFAWEAAAGPDARLRAAIQGRLAMITRVCRGRIDAHLAVSGDEDFPDVRLLARDILRIEAVEWAVSIAGGPGEAADLRHLAHHAARRAVQWAGRVFERFKADPDEFTHFDAVSTLSAADDLLVVILRVMESDRDDRRAGSHPFVLTLGEQALQDFVDGLEHMTRRYLDIAEAHLLADGPPGAFVLSVLQLVQRVLRLGHALLLSVELIEIRLNHQATLARMARFRSRLRAALKRPDAPREYAARLAVVKSALAELGD